MNNPLVSIIVPVYNVQNSVARCLESICAQTWKNIEVILVNDGSRDESFSICEQFREKDPRIVLVDKSNSGVSETRNCGMSLARGKYVQFVDSYAPYWMVIPANSSKATQALENLQENLGIDAEKKPDDIREYGFLPEGIYDRDTFALRLMEKPASFFYSVLWNKLYRRDILADHHLQFQSGLPLCAEPPEHLPHPDQSGFHRAEQTAGVPLLQGAVHKAGPVRSGAAAAV